MANRNLKQAHIAKEKFYKNIEIELIPNIKATENGEPVRCEKVRIYEKRTGELILEESTGCFCGNASANDFENLFIKEDLKLSIKNKDLDSVLNNQSIEHLLNNDYGLEIVNSIEDAFSQIYLYSAFHDRKNRKDTHIQSFCAYFGLWKKNKEIYFKQHNEAFCKNNPCLQFEGNKIHTLEEIGKIIGIVKEAARQKIDRVFLYFSLIFLQRFKETIYKINYILNHRQNYIIIDNIKELAVYEKLLKKLFDDYGEDIGFYIDLPAGLIIKKNTSFENLLDDETIPYLNRKKLEEKLNKNYVYIDGKRIICSKKELIEYYFKTYCKDPIKLSDIQKNYKKLLEKHNLGNRDDLLYDERGLGNKLANQDNSLLSFGKKYRYYETEKMEEVSQALNLDIYNDVIISSQKIYNDNLDLMVKYDIRDCYELHNILNKTIRNKNIIFKKMPTICFGKADRNHQIFELLKKLAPISAKKLAKAYEYEYGDSKNTISGTYFNSIAQYKVGNEYVYNF